MPPSNGSSGCLRCQELENLIAVQKDKLSTIEVRLRDCVKAYKQVLQEKSIILQNLEASKELAAKKDEEGEARLAQLESSLAQLSVICGKYEATNIQNQMVIEKLTQQCEDLSKKLAAFESNPKSADDLGEKDDRVNNLESDKLSKPIMIHQWTQTYVEPVQKREEKPIQTKSNTENKETQTTQEQTCNPLKPRKAECAIVLPTHRDVDSDKGSDGRRGSRGSRESVSETVFTDNDSTFTDGGDHRFENSRPSLGSVSAINQDVSTNSVSLFYVNELARKEIELAETKLSARENECALRELKWKYHVDTFKLQSKINQMEQQLKQIQNDDTSKPNLTYIRNVLIRFLKTKDKNQRTCMMNALFTAMGVDPKEVKK